MLGKLHDFHPYFSFVAWPMHECHGSNLPEFAAERRGERFSSGSPPKGVVRFPDTKVCGVNRRSVDELCDWRRHILLTDFSRRWLIEAHRSRVRERKCSPEARIQQSMPPPFDPKVLSTAKRLMTKDLFDLSRSQKIVC